MNQVLRTMPGGASLVAQMVKNTPVIQETPDLTPGSGRSPGEGNGNPLQFLPGESRGQRSLAAAVHGVAKSQTRLSN